MCRAAIMRVTRCARSDLADSPAERNYAVAVKLIGFSNPPAHQIVVRSNRIMGLME